MIISIPVLLYIHVVLYLKPCLLSVFFSGNVSKDPHMCYITIHWLFMMDSGEDFMPYDQTLEPWLAV